MSMAGGGSPPRDSAAGSRDGSASIQGYEVLSLLGRGGFANVYRARNRRTGGEVAIKLIDKVKMRANDMVDRVRNEVEIHSRLKHPSILELYEYFEDDNYVYLVLEIANLGGIQEYMSLPGRGAFPEPQARKLLAQIVQGLQYLHSHGIMHRDLTVSNLLLTGDLDVKIADFGLAAQIKASGDPHRTMCGTANFIAPEVVARKEHGLASDIWSLGCLLYTFLVGRPPFEKHGERAVEDTLANILHGDYNIPEDCASPAARDLIAKLLQRDPSKRLSLTEVQRHAFFQISSPNNIAASASRLQHSARSNGSANTDSAQSMSLRRGGVAVSIGAPSTLPNSTVLSAGDSLVWGGSDGGPLGASLHALSASVGRSQAAGTPLSPQLDLPSPVLRSSSGGGGVDSYHTGSTTAAAATMGNGRTPLASSSPAQAAQGAQLLALNTRRLRPIAHRTRTATISIEADGSVRLDMVASSAARQAQPAAVSELSERLEVSADGERVTVAWPRRAGDAPADFQRSTFLLPALPRRYHNKYLYVQHFVQLVRAKTPKVTVYTDRAKCMLMESSELVASGGGGGGELDFDCRFYTGAKVTVARHAGGEGAPAAAVGAAALVTIIDDHGATCRIEAALGAVGERARRQSAAVGSLVEHTLAALHRCQQLHAAHAGEGPLGGDAFPLVLGRRPKPAAAERSPPGRAAAEKTAAERPGTIAPSGLSLRKSSDSGHGSAVSTDREALAAAAAAAAASAAASFASPVDLPLLAAAAPGQPVQVAFDPAHGWAFLLASGETWVLSKDGTQLVLAPSAEVLEVRCGAGATERHDLRGSMAVGSAVRQRLAQVAAFVKLLRRSAGDSSRASRAAGPQ